jgi:hypothetical protein
MRLAAITLLTALPLLAGCATVMNGPHQPINVQTVPPGAECSVDRYRFLAPGVVVISRDNAPALTITCDMAGYKTAKATVRSRMSSWFFGNIVTGVLPGMIVDGLTGGANIYEPNIVQLTLERE